MKRIVDIFTNVAIVIACALIVAITAPQLKERWSGSAPRPTAGRREPVEPVKDLRLALPKANLRGDPHARIALIEFSDFQCPYCGRYSRDTAADVQKLFVESGKMVYAFRNFPLSQIHPLAVKAGQAALCAGDQQKFWPMHDQLFVHQGALDATSLVDYANQLGLDRRQFTSCLKSESAALKEDIAEAKRAGVESTPTFVIGAIQGNGDLLVSTRIRGAQPLQVLRNAIETVLKAAAHQRAS